MMSSLAVSCAVIFSSFDISVSSFSYSSFVEHGLININEVLYFVPIMFEVFTDDDDSFLDHMSKGTICTTVVWSAVAQR